ncbi:hypothetical protein FYJ24_00310 [Actinomycetaceae bacterium WB03_NA08]|uniref:Integral membrane protein n=1 Tax=Scrofimicrobium canadense TaxID=2652290 RepID=A0A6N7VNF0_9ACTO|nr:hypothetical protein [Scrofimicrobium canadense]MSS83234.1 hypothetical protein [Scrofimicrobium canadense]
MATLRSVLATILIAIGVLAAPLTVLGHWTTTSLVDQDGFIDLYEPVASSPVFHDYVAGGIADTTSEALSTSILGSTSESLSSSIASTARQWGLPDSWASAIEAAPENADEALHDGVRDTALAALDSPEFHQAWPTLLRQVHTDFISAVDTPGEDTAVLTIATGPLIETFRASLVDQGLPIASLIPDIDLPLPFATVSGIDEARSARTVLGWFATWGGVVTAIALLLGILVAPSRFLALGLAGLFCALSTGALLLIAWTIGPQVMGHGPLPELLWSATINPLVDVGALVAEGSALVALLGFALHIATRKNRRRR